MNTYEIRYRRDNNWQTNYSYEVNAGSKVDAEQIFWMTVPGPITAIDVIWVKTK